MNGLDWNVFRAINSMPDSLAPFFLFFSEGTKWTSVRIGLLAIFVVLVWLRGTRAAALLSMPAWLVANEVTDVLKLALQWPRPSWKAGIPGVGADWPEVIVRVEPLTSFGTASAHSANMAAIATVFWFFEKRVAAAWTAVALVTGLSRVYVGVHFPSQVLFGWCCGVFVGWMAVKTYEAGKRINDAKRAAGR